MKHPRFKPDVPSQFSDDSVSAKGPLEMFKNTWIWSVLRLQCSKPNPSWSYGSMVVMNTTIHQFQQSWWLFHFLYTRNRKSGNYAFGSPFCAHTEVIASEIKWKCLKKYWQRFFWFPHVIHLIVWNKQLYILEWPCSLLGPWPQLTFCGQGKGEVEVWWNED